MLLYISILSIIISVILFFLNARLYRSSVYLAGFFFLNSLYSLNIYALYYSKSDLLVTIALLYSNFSIFLHGPMLYWYIRSTLTDNPRLKRSDAWHLVPAVIFFCLSLPYIFAPIDEKLRIASEFVSYSNGILKSQPSILYPVIPARIVVLIKSFQALAYLFASIWMLSGYLKSGKKNHIISGQKIMTRWLLVLLGFLLILAVSDSIIQIETIFTKDSRLFSTFNIFRISSSIGLVGLMISPFFFPSILYGLPLVPSSTVTIQEADSEKRETRQGDRKIKLHVLEDEYLKHIEGTIESSMQEYKPYLKDDFNLTQLSVIINIPVHHLAYYFREHLHQSFHDYRNKWRIEHAKLMILEGKAKGLKLEAIGTLSGFSSRNTFFVAFKRAEGMSPGEFASRLNS